MNFSQIRDRIISFLLHVVIFGCRKTATLRKGETTEKYDNSVKSFILGAFLIVFIAIGTFISSSLGYYKLDVILAPLSSDLGKLVSDMADDGAGDVLESWEELEDTGVLDKKLQEIKITEQTPNENVIVHDANDRTPYQPQVRILKRKSDSQCQSANQDQRNQGKPMKTLEQREAEYAQARLRILGSAYAAAPEPTQASSTSTEVDNRPPRLMQTETTKQNMQSNCNVEILRQPRGPDGTSGFDQNR